MHTFAQFSIFLVAALHFLFFILEKFYWNTPLGHRIFKLTPEGANVSAVLAANQGVYNLILGLGLIWALISHDHAWSSPVKLFILVFILFVGSYGSITVGKGIFFLQTLPALIALVLTLIVMAEPKINDITTSFSNPPQFKGNYTYPNKFSKIQMEYYPNVLPVSISRPTSEVHKMIENLIRSNTNWEIKNSDPLKGRIEATVSTQFFRFTDDISIELRSDQDQNSIIHLRSRSRTGKSDFGVNAKRIVEFNQLIRATEFAELIKDIHRWNVEKTYMQLTKKRRR